MEKVLIFIGPLIGGIIMYLIIHALVKAPGAGLQSRFARVTKDTNGVIKGKTLQQIVSVCGQPSARSSMGDGTTLCQWQATSYHVALLFDENDVCLGVSSEIKV